MKKRVGTIDIRPSPEGYAYDLATVLINADAVGRGEARKELARLLVGLWRDDYDFANNRWWDSKSDFGNGPTYLAVLKDEYPWGDT